MQTMANPYKKEWTNPGGEKKTAWIANYVDQSGQRRRCQFPKKKEAEAALLKIRSELKDGIHTPDSESITVKEAAKNWIEACKRGRNGREPVEPHTLRQYQSHVDIHIIPALGNRRLSQMTAPDAAEYRNTLLNTVSRAMAKKILTSFKSIVSEAQLSGKVAQNVVMAVSITSGKRHQSEITIPSRAEIKTIIEKLQDLSTQDNKQRALHWTRYYAFLATAILTGMRASELRGLSWDHVDLDNGLIHVKQRADEKGIIGPPKSAAGNRIIQIPGPLISILNGWRPDCPICTDSLTFPNGQGKCENLANIHTRAWKPIQVKTGIVTREGKAKYTFHAIRHYRASVLIAAGADPKEVMKEMGHASITMTYNTYGHLFPEDDGKRKARASKIAEGIFS